MEGRANAQLSGVGARELERQRITAEINDIIQIIQTLYNMFAATGEVEYIDNAIGLAKEPATVPSCNFTGLGELIYQLGEFSSGRRSVSNGYMEFGVSDGTPLATTTDHAGSYGASHQVGSLYRRRYEECGGVGDFGEAIGQAEGELAVAPAGNLVGDRHERLPNVEDLEKAIKSAEGALVSTRADDPNRAVAFGTWPSKKHDRLGHLEDLKNGIKRIEEELTSNPADDPNRETLLGNLSNRLGGWYSRFGSLEGFEAGIKRIEEALASTPADGPNRATLLGNLNTRLCAWCGSLEGLETGIKWIEEALASTIADGPNRETLLGTLSNRLGVWYGSLEGLGAGTMRIEEALASTPADGPNRATLLDSLGIWLGSRYDRLGNSEDLENAIKQTEEALALVPTDNPTRVPMLRNLGEWLGRRYNRFGALEDLEKAIKQYEEALAVTPTDHSHYAAMLANLSTALHSRFLQLGVLGDLEEAISIAERAGAVIPGDHPDSAIGYHILGGLLKARFGRLGALGDLEGSIRYGREALAATPAGHSSRAKMLHSLGLDLRLKYAQLGILGDLQEAIELLEEAVISTSAISPFQGLIMTGLGSSLCARYKATHDVKDLHYALSISQEAWSCIMSPPSSRIIAGQEAANLLASMCMWGKSCAILEDAIKLLSAVNPRFLRRDDQGHLLSGFSQLAGDAVATALHAEKEVSHCLRVLELGRGITMGLAMDCRRDLSELQAKHPDVFRRFNLLRADIDLPLGSNNDTYEQTRDWRVRTVGQLSKTLADIRQLPGFEGFQLLPSSEDLMGIAQEGPIIILNSTIYRSDAIVVSGSVIKALPLPGLVYEETKQWMRQLRRGIIRGKPSTYSSRNMGMKEFLLWLWDTMVEPVFRGLEFHPIVDSSTLPRLWWIGLGPLAMAPFHAAGDHSPGSTRNTISRAISSYIPTIKALSYARERKLELLSGGDSNLLLVTMPTTPGKSSLRSVDEEVYKIASVIDETTGTMLLESPSAPRVLEELMCHQAVHFACHAVPDDKNPSNSHLVLLKDNGSESGAVDRLTVNAISSTNIKSAQIAYLSACSTAENCSVDLADEPIHIASGFQLAGFSHVLATLWKSNDIACQEVAVEFYRLLFDGQGDKGHAKVSYAFHHAVKKLREKYLRQPLIWTPFIHTGA